MRVKVQEFHGHQIEVFSRGDGSYKLVINGRANSWAWSNPESAAASARAQILMGWVAIDEKVVQTYNSKR